MPDTVIRGNGGNFGGVEQFTKQIGNQGCYDRGSYSPTDMLNIGDSFGQVSANDMRQSRQITNTQLVGTSSADTLSSTQISSQLSTQVSANDMKQSRQITSTDTIEASSLKPVSPTLLDTVIDWDIDEPYLR
jgi:hypothetical protein